MANPLTLPSSSSLSSFFSSSEAVLGGVSGLLKSSLSQAASTVRAFADDNSSQRSLDNARLDVVVSQPSSSSAVAPSTQLLNSTTETEFDRLERDLISKSSDNKSIPGNINSTSTQSVPDSTTPLATSTPSYPAEEDLDSLENFLASLAKK